MFEQVKKHKRIQTLRNTLNKIHTPPSLRDFIINQVHNYYNDGLTNEDDLENAKIIMMNKSIINQPPTTTQQRTKKIKQD